MVASRPRHLLSIADVSGPELATLVRNAHAHKAAMKSQTQTPTSLSSSLAGKTIAMMFSKRSTRTRVSTESAIAAMGGHPMFLGKDDIQLGVNESLYDTSVVVSSMVAGMVARVAKHEDVAGLARDSSVPVINGLCDLHHPLQTVADYLTMFEAFGPEGQQQGLGLEGRKIAWVGDANNVLFDLAIGAVKLGVDISVATPKTYDIPPAILKLISHAQSQSTANTTYSPGQILHTNVPEEAVKDADIIVTDTWTSMGQEEEKAKRLRDFAGFQVTEDLAQRGGAKGNWRFMHCLPRHPEEVNDGVFYGPRSLVFPEAENRLWAAIAALEAFVVNKGRIL